jgi:type III restriction enzyme
VDILEPHDDTRTDTWAKAKGLSTFADQHGMDFGRLTIARKHGAAYEKADVNDKAKRQKARAMQSASDLESLFS